MAVAFGTEGGFEEMRPAYDFGYRSASDGRYKGRSWNDVEDDLQTDYEVACPESNWEEVRSPFGTAGSICLPGRFRPDH